MSISTTHPPILVQLRERCGLRHDRQILLIAAPESLSLSCLRDLESRLSYPVQRSMRDPRIGFVEVELAPFQSLTLVAPDSIQENGPVLVESWPGAVVVSAEWIGNNPQAVISNGVFAIQVPVGSGEGGHSNQAGVPGPVTGVRIGEGPWRGRTLIDSRRPLKQWRGELLETGPLRVVYEFNAEFSASGFYRATITVDRGEPLAVVEEEFEVGSGDQVVWDFHGADLPGQFYLLDSSASYQTLPLHYHLDLRLTRMLAWTQQSQHFGFSDGYAIGFAPDSGEEGVSRDIAGFVALEGGTWRGNKLNQMEAWTRRWFPGDLGSRRDVPPEAKSDGNPSPELIEARGTGICEPHFNIEGWIGSGRRKWALVLTTLEKIAPADNSGEPLGPFEDQPDRPRYQAQQSLLRKIHIQRGILPLQEMLGMAFDWEQENSALKSLTPGQSGEASSEPVHSFQYPNPILDRHFQGASQATLDPAEARTQLIEYLAARVYGFWEGSGSAYTNPVVSRRIAPEMFRYEWLISQGALTQEQNQIARAQFAFLMHLFASENYYTGEASMLSVSSSDSLDPTIAGMANQNFYTDVINVYGTGAQVFWKHPCAASWGQLFIERWHRQLAFHMYPESGVWEESHTYYHHVLHTVLPTFLRRRADGVGDEFANPALQKLVGAELHQLTPRDAFFEDCRHVVSFGDHDVDVTRYRYLMREFARAIEPYNPMLAGHLAWAYQEMKGGGALSVAPQAPALRNEYVQGLGVMFRGLDEEGAECLLALRSGSAWGHHHSDDGSIQFFANGRSIIVDAGFAGAGLGRKKFEANGHSRWTLKHFDPVNFLWRFNRGWVTASALEEPLAFATVYSPVFMVRGGVTPAVPLTRPVIHCRTVVQIASSAYLILDVSDSDQDQSVHFHVPGEAVSIVEGQVTVSTPEGLVPEARGQLRLISFSPTGPAQVELEHPSHPHGQRFATTSLQYEMGKASFAAFLLAMEPNDAPALEMVVTGSGWRLQGATFEVSIERGHSGKVLVRDHRRGCVREVDPCRWPL